DDGRPGGRRRLVGGEEEGDVGDLGGAEVAAEGVHRGDVVERAAAEPGEPLEGGGQDGAGADAVGADVLATVLERHRAGQVDHAALGRVVRAPEDAAVKTFDRLRVDDRASAVRV